MLISSFYIVAVAVFFGVLFNSCAAHFWVGRKAPLAMLPEIAWAALISAFLAVRRKEQGDRLPTIFRQKNLALRYSSNVTNTRREREYLASRINHCMKFSRNWITCRRIRQTQTFSLNQTLCVRSSLWSESLSQYAIQGLKKSCVHLRGEHVRTSVVHHPH